LSFRTIAVDRYYNGLICGRRAMLKTISSGIVHFKVGFGAVFAPRGAG